MKALKHLNKYFYKYRYRLLLGIFITVIAKIFALFTPRLIGLSINVVSDRLQGKISEDVFKQELIVNISYVVGAAVLAGIFTFLMRQTIINVSRYIEFDLKNEVYAHYQKLSLSFYKANRTGDLMNRITEDVSKVREFAGPAIMYSINTITLFVVALIYMYQRSPELTLYTVLPLPVLSIFIYKISQIINERSRIVQESLSTLSAFTQERFSGVSVIKSYGIEPLTNRKFEVLANGNRAKQINLTKIQALFFPLMILIIGLSNIIVAYFGGLFYMQGKISDIGTIAEFLIYVNMLTWPVAVIGWVTNLIQQAEASQKRINEFLKQEPEITNSANDTLPILGDIEFKNVDYTYPDTNIKAIKSLSFAIPKGKTLAILGKTGSGKSTVLDLIGRLYDADSGVVLIDKKPIKKINLFNLREQIGYVPQDAFLFSDTIKTNIMFGDEDATDEDVIKAAKNAKVHDNIIGFKEGYETVLGERGITLSGGQKQRISIARAIIKKPQILLFDDCLSAVDTETEEKILKNLNSISSNRTTVIVSHRVSSVKNADQIIVLEAGNIVQSGTHNTLINQEGYYKDLYLKQLSEKEAS